MKRAKNTSSAKSGGVVVSRRTQLFFIGVLAFAWTVSVVSVVVLYASSSGNVTPQLWAMQMMQWLLPLLFVGLAYGFFARHRMARVQRLFLASVVGLGGLIAYGAVAGLVNMASLRFNWTYNGMAEPSFLQSFGYDMAIMAFGLAAYAATLGYGEWRLRNRK